MEKIFNQKNFSSRVNIYINFCLQVHFKVSAAWYVAIICHRCRWYRWQICRRCRWYTGVVDTPASLTPVANLPPVSLAPVANLPPVSTTLAKMVAKFATGIVDTGGKFAAAVVDTGGNFAAGVDTGGAPWLANISSNFRKKLKRSLRDTLGLGGNWFMKKTRSKKFRDTVPLKVDFELCSKKWKKYLHLFNSPLIVLLVQLFCHVISVPVHKEQV